MSKEQRNDKRTYRLLIYGLDRIGINPPKSTVTERNYELHFEPFDTESRFQDFDGVILFQGIFESFRDAQDWMNNFYYKHTCFEDELDRRDNELKVLLKHGGIACFILNRPFIDRDRYDHFEDTDLAKRALNYDQVYRENLARRIPTLRAKRSEFARFLEIYGAASSEFTIYNDKLEARTIAVAGNRIVAFVFWDRLFFVPALLPEGSEKRTEEYFCLLADALVSSHIKLQQETPEWIQQFAFDDEAALSQEVSELETRIEAVNRELKKLDKYKRILAFYGELLVESVAEVLQEGFGFNIDPTDEFREDLKILDDQGDPIMLVEIKGTNRGVRREHINQCDSHRERSGLSSDFPAILVMNTHIKNARTIREKDQPVNSDQIAHAVRTKVLILRTLDLLRLLKKVRSGETNASVVLERFTGNSGWLSVDEEGIEEVHDR